MLHPQLIFQAHVDSNCKKAKMVFDIRPREEKHPALLPLGETASFRIKKDKMLLRVQEMDDKEHKYSVVSMRPISEQK